MPLNSGGVIGVDVGWSAVQRSSAICRLDWSANAVSWKILRFRATEPERGQAIRKIAAGDPVMGAAFDGPLRRGLDIIGRYRTAERMLTRRLQPLIGKPGQSSSANGKMLNRHANECVRHLIVSVEVSPASHDVPIDDKAVLEAFPTSFLGMMIENPERLTVQRGKRSDVFYQHLASIGVLDDLLRYCLPGQRASQDFALVSDHDDRAAVVCALTALCVATGDFVAVGDEDGWIILPPRRFIRPAQWKLLEMNAEEETSAALYIADTVAA